MNSRDVSLNVLIRLHVYNYSVSGWIVVTITGINAKCLNVKQLSLNILKIIEQFISNNFHLIIKIEI